MKIVYLLRHAKAENADILGDDSERKLAPRGEEACVTIGHMIAEKKYIPDFALVSSAMRTQMTFTQAMGAANIAPTYRVEKKLYLAHSEEIIKLIQATDDTIHSLMVVGHNPGMHHAAVTLSQETHNDLRDILEIKYPTGALTVLRFDIEHWQDLTKSSGEILDFITPSEV